MKDYKDLISELRTKPSRDSRKLLDDAADAIEQLQREMDAVCADLTTLKKGNECRICMHRFNLKICEHCSYFDSKFEWRGIDETN